MILVNQEETNPKIVDIWFIGVGLMNIQLGYFKVLFKISNIACEQIMPTVVLGELPVVGSVYLVRSSMKTTRG